MKNYICLDGNKIEISDETAKNLREQFKEPEFDLQIGDSVYYPSYDEKGALVSKISTKRNLGTWESKSEKTILRAEVFISLQNWADKNNEEFSGCAHFIMWERTSNHVYYGSHSTFTAGYVYFSSERIAQKAVEHFGEDFIKLYLGVE